MTLKIYELSKTIRSYYNVKVHGKHDITLSLFYYCRYNKTTCFKKVNIIL